MPEEGQPLTSHEEVLRLEEIVGIVSRLATRFGLRGVRLTGGEPLVRRGLVHLVAMLADLDLADLAMTTNALALERFAEPLARAGLRRVNVSLDSLDAERFSRLTRGGDLDRVLRGIDAAIRAGLTPVKANVVLLRGENEDEAADLLRFGADRDVEVRFLELMALGASARTQPELVVTAGEVRQSLEASGFSFEPAPAPAGAPATRWTAILPDGRRARAGFIAPESAPFCHTCRRLRLTATGRLLGCLMHEDGPDLRAAMRGAGGVDEEAFDRSVVEATALKPACRIPASGRPMHAVGG
jgi:cyclic pyranopterin phosphate synthase